MSRIRTVTHIESHDLVKSYLESVGDPLYNILALIHDSIVLGRAALHKIDADPILEESAYLLKELINYRESKRLNQEIYGIGENTAEDFNKNKSGAV